MISYVTKEGYVQVKWNRTEIGRITKEGRQWYYKPRGCNGEVTNGPFTSLPAVKKHIEQGVPECKILRITP